MGQVVHAIATTPSCYSTSGVLIVVFVNWIYWLQESTDDVPTQLEDLLCTDLCQVGFQPPCYI